MTCDMMKPCKVSAALISGPPKGHRGYDLGAASKKLVGAGYVERALLPKILIVRDGPDGLESSIYPSGKILVKTRDERNAKRQCRRLRSILDQ